MLSNSAYRWMSGIRKFKRGHFLTNGKWKFYVEELDSVFYLDIFGTKLSGNFE
jgi:hypothetical protein